jgi:acyl-CoA thioesterase
MDGHIRRSTASPGGKTMKALLFMAALAFGGVTMAQAAPAATHTAKLPMCSKTVTKHCMHPSKTTAHKSPAQAKPAPTKTPTGK